MIAASPERRAARVKALAAEIGFDLVGVAPTSADDAYARYREAMEAGYGADMGWLQDAPELRRDAREVHAAARSVVTLGVSYWSDTPGYLESPPSPEEGWIARYAQGKDYHVQLRRMLVRLVRDLRWWPLR